MPNPNSNEVAVINAGGVDYSTFESIEVQREVWRTGFDRTFYSCRAGTKQTRFSGSEVAS